ncbi:MAG: hypothetical protein WCX74_02055 [Candidatus Paceibacterota bacterium]
MKGLCVIIKGVISPEDCPEHPAYVHVIAPSVKEAKDCIRNFFEEFRASVGEEILLKIKYIPTEVLVHTLDKSEIIAYDLGTLKDDGTYECSGFASMPDYLSDAYLRMSLEECFEQKG